MCVYLIAALLGDGANVSQLLFVQLLSCNSIMSYFTFNMSASTQGPSTPKNPQRSSSSNSAVPQLDHDSSTLPINSSATMLCEPTVSGQTALNPEAQWSGFNSSLLQVDGAFSGSALPPYDQSTLHAALTTNDDLRW